MADDLEILNDDGSEGVTLSSSSENGQPVVKFSLDYSFFQNAINFSLEDAKKMKIFLANFINENGG
jgi:hypothetical protein